VWEIKEQELRESLLACGSRSSRAAPARKKEIVGLGSAVALFMPRKPVLNRLEEFPGADSGDRNR
jgi:hypothetical protein